MLPSTSGDSVFGLSFGSGFLLETDQLVVEIIDNKVGSSSSILAGIMQNLIQFQDIECR